MLKLAVLFAVIAVIAGIFGFVIDVAGGIAKILFFICLVGFVISLVMRQMGGGRTGG
jgi:uncharacterized membrane protein YtjA (UPF0391 family)